MSGHEIMGSDSGGGFAMRINGFLAVNEQAVAHFRLHWVVLARVVLGTAAALVVVLAISVFATSRNADTGVLVSLLWWAVLALVVRLLWRVFDWHRNRLLITSSRLIRVSGIISTKIESIPLSKITDMSYELDPNGRVLGYGTFKLETEGDHKSALEKLTHVPRPGAFYLLLCDCIFGGAPEPAAEEY